MGLKREDEFETDCFVETERKRERVAKTVLFMKSVNFEGEFSLSLLIFTTLCLRILLQNTN